MKHTPGPWTTEEGELNGLWEGVVYNDMIGTICSLDDEMSDCRDNARLIAASPDLLTIVKDLLFEFDEVTDAGQQDLDSVLRKARKVIDRLENA